MAGGLVRRGGSFGFGADGLQGGWIFLDPHPRCGTVRGMDYAQIKFVEVADLPEDAALVATPERMAEIRRAMTDRLDVMIRAAIGGPLPPAETTSFVWPPSRKPFDPYGLIAIRNIA